MPPLEVVRYRFFCATEGVFREAWSADGPPRCPVDPGHEVDAESVTVLGPAGEAGPGAPSEHSVDNVKVVDLEGGLVNLLTVRAGAAGGRLCPRTLAVGSDGPLSRASTVHVTRGAEVSGPRGWVGVGGGSSAEYDTTGARVSGGRVVLSFPLGGRETRLLGVALEGLAPGEALTVACRLSGPGSSDVSCALSWGEENS